jgi:hypothetical protein
MARTGSLRDEPTIEELVAAREQTDAGNRLAFPMLAERIGGGATDHLPIEDAPVMVVDEELVGRVADKAAEFRHEAFRELRHLDKNAPRRIHVAALALVAECDEFLAVVSDHLRSES